MAAQRNRNAAGNRGAGARGDRGGAAARGGRGAARGAARGNAVPARANARAAAAAARAVAAAERAAAAAPAHGNAAQRGRGEAAAAQAAAANEQALRQEVPPAAPDARVAYHYAPVPLVAPENITLTALQAATYSSEILRQNNDPDYVQGGSLMAEMHRPVGRTSRLAGAYGEMGARLAWALNNREDLWQFGVDGSILRRRIFEQYTTPGDMRLLRAFASRTERAIPVAEAFTTAVGPMVDIILDSIHAALLRAAMMLYILYLNDGSTINENQLKLFMGDPKCYIDMPRWMGSLIRKPKAGEDVEANSLIASFSSGKQAANPRRGQTPAQSGKKKGTKCFRCKQYGHIGKDCPKPAAKNKKD